MRRHFHQSHLLSGCCFPSNRMDSKMMSTKVYFEWSQSKGPGLNTFLDGHIEGFVQKCVLIVVDYYRTGRSVSNEHWNTHRFFLPFEYIAWVVRFNVAMAITSIVFFPSFAPSSIRIAILVCNHFIFVDTCAGNCVYRIKQQWSGSNHTTNGANRYEYKKKQICIFISIFQCALGDSNHTRTKPFCTWCVDRYALARCEAYIEKKEMSNTKERIATAHMIYKYK